MARNSFGTRLRSLRERAGMNQSRLAEKVGADQSHISRWERSIAVPELKMIEFLAAALGVSADELLTGQPPKPPNTAQTSAPPKVRFLEDVLTHLAASETTHRDIAKSSRQPGQRKWLEAQERVLLDEYRKATGNTATSMQEAENWFTGLPLAQRDRVGRRLRDPSIIGRYLQTPRIH